MLVLSRQRDETIKIGNNIDITIVAIKGDRVRVGITAPPDIPVHRKEVFDEIHSKQEQQGASGASPARGLRVPIFTGNQTEDMYRILDKQFRMLENASKQGAGVDFSDRYRKLCEEMIELLT